MTTDRALLPCRFDCLCVVKDTVDAALDERLAKFVVESHHNSHPANTMDELERAAAGAAAPAAPWQADNLVEQPLLKLYIAYAKRHCHPKLQDADTEKMVQVRSRFCMLCACMAFAFVRSRFSRHFCARCTHQHAGKRPACSSAVRASSV